MLIERNNFAEEILIFSNGQEALDYFELHMDDLETSLPNVIMLDLNMPIMNGWEFLERMEPYVDKLKAREVKLNVVSSTINPEEVRRAESLQIVNHFINKPISKEAIARAFTKRN